MFPTYLYVLLPGEVGVGLQDHLPGLALAHRPAKDVGVVGDDTLDARHVNTCGVATYSKSSQILTIASTCDNATRHQVS